MSDKLTFNQEELRARFNPEGSPLRRQQMVMLEMLKELDRICRKHKIPYFLYWGTLLGAIRHDGFIPWDDDMDSGMMREDYNKLVDVLPEELERNGLKDNIKINFRQRNAFVEGATSFLQLFYYNTLSGGGVDLTALDVFPYDYMKQYDG